MYTLQFCYLGNIARSEEGISKADRHCQWGFQLVLQ